MTQSRALSNAQILRAAIVVLVGFLASGVLGVVRTAVFSATFGTSAELDALYAAQRIPEILFTVVAGGALGSSFIPVFSRFLSKDDQAGAWRLASAVMTLSAGAAAILAVVIIVIAPVLVPAVLVPGASSAQQALTVSLTRIMLVTTVIFAISGLLMGILNAHQQFLLPALALSLYNIGQISGALVITRFLPLRVGVNPTVFEHLASPILPQTVLLGFADRFAFVNIYGLAFGMVLGSMLHLIVQVPGLFQVKARLRVLADFRVEGVREVLVMMGPRVLGLAVVQINFAVNIAFASTMKAGSLVALNTAWFLMFFTLGIIGQSVGTAVFPTLSALAAENDMPGYRLRLASAMRAILFLAIPATIGLILLAEPIVAVLFQRGEWTVESTRATAWALSFFAMGIVGHGLLEVLSRAFYALSDTWTPVRIGILAMVSNIILSVILIRVIGDPGSLERGPFAGLALANSATTLLEAGALWLLLSRRVDGIQDRHVLNGVLKTMIGAAVMGAVLYSFLQSMNDQSDFLTMVGGVVVGAGTFFIAALLTRQDELNIILNRLNRLKR